MIDSTLRKPADYMAEDAGAADRIAGRPTAQLGISRGWPEQVIDGWRHSLASTPSVKARAMRTWDAGMVEEVL